MAQFILDSKKVIEQVNSLKSLGEVWYNLKTNPDYTFLQRTSSTFFESNFS